MLSNAGKRVPVHVWIARIAASPQFREGWEAAAKQQPYPVDAGPNYERGRHFYAWYQQQGYPRAVWRKGVMAKTVQQRLLRAVHERAVL